MGHNETIPSFGSYCINLGGVLDAEQIPKGDGEPSAATILLQPLHTAEVTADGEEVSRYRET